MKKNTTGEPVEGQAPIPGTETETTGSTEANTTPAAAAAKNAPEITEAVKDSTPSNTPRITETVTANGNSPDPLAGYLSGGYYKGEGTGR